VTNETQGTCVVDVQSVYQIAAQQALHLISEAAVPEEPVPLACHATNVHCSVAAYVPEPPRHIHLFGDQCGIMAAGRLACAT
jgi:hypothetical protein